MKLIIKEYLSSLNEEQGLNELIPKLYLLNGYTIINVAQKGVRQNGVDILAEKNGEPYLLTIKQGDLRRDNWNNNPTSLRQSLDDIIDAYIPNELPIKYKGKKIHIDIILNGHVEQAIQSSLTGYEKRYKDYIFSQINIDSLTKLVYSLLLNENLFPADEASMLRKCLALINEQDFQLNNYIQLIDKSLEKVIASSSKKRTKREISKLIMLQNIICEWDCQSEVYVNKIKCCETLLLKITSSLFTQSKNKNEAKDLYNAIMKIYIDMLERYYFNAKRLENTYRALPIFSEIGHQLKLFEILGILSMYGLILLYQEKEETERINSVHNLIINILSNYDGTLYIPMEYNCCEISILLLFLYKLNDIGSSKNYVISLLNCQAINYLKNKKFPFPYEDYYEALKASTSKKNTFNSSLVLECLYDWLILLNGTSDEEIDLEIYKKTFKDVSLQLWIYDCEDEIEFYKGHKNTGCCYIMPELSTFDRRKKILRKIIKEIKFKDYLSEKKKIPYISVVASRLYKMPVNPYLYLKDL